MAAPIRIGTCSWADESLTRYFYPPGVKGAEERLRYYAERFDTVEANSTYYSLPAEEMVRRWHERTPEDFVMHVKAFGVMTRHPVKVEQLPPDLREGAPVDERGRVDRPPREFRAEVFRRFHEALEPLRRNGKLGGILMQLPPYVVFKPASLEYLEWAQGQLGSDEMLVEFRHASWLEEENRRETLAFLERNGMSYVIVDAPRMEARNVSPTVVAATTATAYVRFHGRNAETWNKRTRSAAERFDYLYSDEELAEWADPLAELSGQSESVFAMFNNNGRSTMPGQPSLESPDGAETTIAQAPVNAQMLRALLEQKGLPVTPAPVASRAMEPWSYDFAGRLDELELESEVLKGNPLGDPHVRPLWVYVPPGYDDDAERRYPSVYVIQGLTGQLDMWRNRSPFRKNFPELVDEMFARGDSPPCLLVYVDAWTSLGGSQFVDSPGTGRYHTYICDEIVPFVDERYRTLPGAEHRGIAGKSSGGYGAMVNPMLRPDVFGGLATHAGDALFEMCYLPEFRQSVRALREHYDRSFERFWEDFRSRPALSKDSDHTLLNDYCMAACYSADEDGTVQLPYDTATGELRPEIWERWLAWDPVRMAPERADALRSLKAIYIDCGRRDQFFLDLGTEAFRRRLDEVGVTDYFFELFDATHSAIEYRYPQAIAYLAERLA